LIVVIMAPKKVTKGAPKRGEKVNTTDIRPKIVVETVNSSDVSVEEVPFDAVEAQQAAASTATTATAHVLREGDEVPVRFNPLKIRKRAETTAARPFAEDAGLMGSETSTPNLYGGQTESDTAVGTILGRGLGRFRSGLDEPMCYSNPLAYEHPFSRRHNQRDGDFGRQETENTPTTGAFGRLRGNSGLSEVDNCRLGSGAEATMRPQGTVNAGISGGDDCIESSAQAGTGIFTNAFANQWTSHQNEPG
jgi:hypothetical protein